MKHKRKSKTQMQAFENALITWKAHEHEHHEKSITWFIIAGFFALGMVIYGLKTDGWTFSVAILVFAGTYYLLYRHSPPFVDIKISKMGVKIGRHIFPYDQIKGFWVIHNPPFVNKLYLKMVSRFHPDIFVSLEDADPAAIRQNLMTHVKELKGRGEPFSDTLVRLFRL